MKVGTRMRRLAVALVALALSQRALAERHHNFSVDLVKTLRIGNNIEDITYIAAGKHKGRVAALNGWDVMSVKVDDRDDEDAWASGEHRSHESGRAEKPESLFDVRELGIGDTPPSGMEFVPSQRRFYFGSKVFGQQDRLFVTDEDGRGLSPLPITYPLSVDPASILQFEGIGYIPRASAAFPDHLAALTIRLPDFNGVIEIIHFDRVGGRVAGGTVVKEIEFAPGTPLYGYLTGLQYAQDPDRLIVASGSFEVWVVSFDGTVSGPMATTETETEGIASLPDGRIALADLALFDGVVVLGPDFTRRPDQIALSVGMGVNRPHGLAWKADTGEFLTTSIWNPPFEARVTAFTSRSAHALTPSDPRLQSLALGDVAYVPATAGSPARLALANPSGPLRGIFLYDTNGNYVSRLLTRGVIQPSANARPFSLAALPGGQFAYTHRLIFPQLEIVTAGGADPTDPTSALASEIGRIDLDAGETRQHPAQVGFGLSFIDVNGGELLSGNSFYDSNGNLLAQFDVTALGLTVVDGATAITSGPLAGHFAAVEADSSTLVIFRLHR